MLESVQVEDRDPRSHYPKVYWNSFLSHKTCPNQNCWIVCYENLFHSPAESMDCLILSICKTEVMNKTQSRTGKWYDLPFFRKIYFYNPGILSHHKLGRLSMPWTEFVLRLFYLLDSKVPIDPMECTNLHLDLLAWILFQTQFSLLAARCLAAPYHSRIHSSLTRIKKTILKNAKIGRIVCS